MSEVTRLFRAFVPRHYTLELSLDTKQMAFFGKVTVEGIVKNVASVALHAKDLQISQVTVDNKHCQFHCQDDELHVAMPDSVDGDTAICIEYTGTITKAMHGIYPAVTNDGSVIIGTQFESHHAREAFPCVDEPEAKATFDITITADAPVILSNMPAKSLTQDDNGKTTVHFERTPIMSSYLVAFVAGDLQRVSTQTENGTEISVWSSKNHDIESLIFPLEVAVKTTEFFNSYFGTPYPLPKCDHVALPEFSAGAMENWGLITYREIALISDPDTVSTATKEYIATVIAHEISHQWFGNLVTMQWWDDLWLNESFANFMEYFAIDAIYPEWNVMLTFAAHEALQAFRRDILPGVQPVAATVLHPDEINTLFDPSIVYAKGGRLLFMAYHIVGDRNFRKGLYAYFKTYAYKNTTGEDLWRCLGEASRVDVAKIMKTWISQPGFPFVRIQSCGEKTVLVQQQQLTTGEPNEDRLWSIPLWHDNQTVLEILDTREKTFAVDSRATRFNTVGGHYVPYYTDPDVRHELYKQVATNDFTADGRLLLLHDNLLLARCGVASLVDALDALTYYKDETEESVWSVIATVIGDTRMMIEGDNKAEAALKTFTYHLVRHQYERIGFCATQDDTINDKKLRGIIASLAVYTEQPIVTDAALDIWNTSNAIEDLPVDSRLAILTAAAKHGKPNDFAVLYDAYPNNNNADVQLDIAAALCSTAIAAHHVQLLSSLQNSDYVRLQDLNRFLVYLLRNSTSRLAAWDWLVTNWPWLTATFANDMSYDSYPRYAGNFFATTELLQAYHDHFSPMKDVAALSRNIELGTKDIEAKITWRLHDQQAVSDWLIARSQQ